MKKRLGFAAAVGGLILGFWLDEPADRVTTTTVTETVEVPGPEVVRYTTPALPDSCVRLIDHHETMSGLMDEYGAAIAPQFDNLNEAVQAIHSGDFQRISDVISTQNRVQLDAGGPMRDIYSELSTIELLTAECDADLEVLR